MMDYSVILRNVEALLKAKKRSADATSRNAGTPDAIRNLRRGKGGMTMRTLIALAQELGTTPAALMNPDMPPPLPTDRESDQRLLEYLIAQRDLLNTQIDEIVARQGSPKSARQKKR